MTKKKEYYLIYCGYEEFIKNIDNILYKSGRFHQSPMYKQVIDRDSKIGKIIRKEFVKMFEDK